MESLVIMLKNVLVFVALALPDFFLVKNRMQIILMKMKSLKVLDMHILEDVKYTLLSTQWYMMMK